MIDDNDDGFLIGFAAEETALSQINTFIILSAIHQFITISLSRYKCVNRPCYRIDHRLRVLVIYPLANFSIGNCTTHKFYP